MKLGKKQNKKIKTKKDEEIQNLQLKCDEYENLAKKIQAEFENFKKQCEKHNDNLAKYSSRDVLQRMLPIFDSFESALKEKNFNREGLIVLHKQLNEIFEKEGLRPINAEGQCFDPYKHEVLIKDNKDSVDDNIITEEIQKGYMLQDQVLRHSKVKVNQKKGEKDEG